MQHLLPRLVTLAALAALLAAPAGAGAAEQYPSGPNYRGIINFGPYALFPENRLGNSVYLDNVRVFSLPDQAIIDVLPLPVEGRFVYLARDAAGLLDIGVRTLEVDGAVDIEPVTEGVYHVTMVLDGVVYKKMYRIIESNLLDLLPASKTADGAVPGPGGVAFYHVATAEREEENGSERMVFGLRLHLSAGEEERVRDLDYLVYNTRARLDLAWLDENTVVYTLADGRSERISVSQFQ